MNAVEPVEIMLDKPRTLLLTFDGVRKIHKELGANLLEGQNPLAGSDPDKLVCLVSILARDADCTPDVVSASITDGAKLAGVLQAVEETFSRFFPPPAAGSTDPNPASPSN